MANKRAAAATAAIRWTKEITNAQVLGLIRSEPDVRKALSVFDAATAEYSSGFRHDLATFALMSSRLAAAGLLPDALAVLARIPDELGRSPDESSFLDLLRAYGRAHRPVDAYRLFQEGPSTLRICPSHRSYTALLAVLVAEKRLDLARSVYESMRAAGVPPTVASYNVLLKALCTDAGGRGPKVDSAIRVFRRMSDRGCPPDACSYNTLIDGLCKQGRVREAKELFNEMDGKNCSATVVTYTSLIHGLCHSNLSDEALELFDEMKKRGIKPNVVTYSSLIDGLCKGGRSVKAMALVDRMIADRCQPNAITYSALISGLCTEGRLTEAIEALDRMRLQGRKPDAGLYGKLIKGLCDSGQCQKAADYLDEMVLSGILPNRVTWGLHVRIHNMVIVALCKKSHVSRAFQVYQGMRTRGISTEPETFHFLVDCVCKKDLYKAARIVSEMLIEGCVPTKETWNIILSGYWDRRKVKESAESLRDELMASCSLGSSFKEDCCIFLFAFQFVVWLNFKHHPTCSL